MKKILLFLFAAVISIAASADEIIFDFSAQGYANAQDFNDQTVDLGSGISVTFSKGTGSITPNTMT